MGWSITLNSNKEISEEEVDRIVEQLPGEFLLGGFMEPSKQDWGWSTAIDISNPRGAILNLSGSYSMSGNIAEPMASYIKEKLEENGHSINIEYCW